MSAARQQRVEKAFYRGGSLTMESPIYRETVCRLTEVLLRDDLSGSDVTAAAMETKTGGTSAVVVAREAGVVAGVEEFADLYARQNADVTVEKRDGETIRVDDVLLRVQGNQATLLGLERVGLNLLQRMSGIATAARLLQERVRENGWETRVVGTRKTPWGLLDKRALHLAGVGTHRLGLGDAILIKNNHLALLGGSEEDAVPQAIERTWSRRGDAAFIEVEVRGEAAARVAGEKFRALRQRERAGEDYPCIVMLDNMEPRQAGAIVQMLQREHLWDDTLVEASGGISESNFLEYAASGVDAVSIGALTHSARALDISQRIL
jgi:nicotinate-nucleotide pyrophosphorylase (carboxylating)